MKNLKSLAVCFKKSQIKVNSKTIHRYKVKIKQKNKKQFHIHLLFGCVARATLSQSKLYL